VPASSRQEWPQDDHPAAGPRAAAARSRQHGHQQIGRGEADAEGEEDAKISEGPRASANATAVPNDGRRAGRRRQGREHAGAELAGERGVAADAGSRPTKAGTGISNQPQSWRRNSVSSSIMAIRNQGCWNWMPQPTALPSLQAPPARRRDRRSDEDAGRRGQESEPHMGADLSPSWPMRPSSFSESTGSTQA